MDFTKVTDFINTLKDKFPSFLRTVYEKSIPVGNTVSEWKGLLLKIYNDIVTRNQVINIDSTGLTVISYPKLPNTTGTNGYPNGGMALGSAVLMFPDGGRFIILPDENSEMKFFGTNLDNTKDGKVISIYEYNPDEIFSSLVMFRRDYTVDYELHTATEIPAEQNKAYKLLELLGLRK